MLPALLPILGTIASKVANHFFPDPEDEQKRRELEARILVQAREQEHALELAALEAAKAQIAVNQEEAKHTSVFVSGWRPGAGWTCVIGLAYSFIIRPLLGFVAGIYDWPVPPAIDVQELLVLLAGMLGLAGFRMREKEKGVARE